MEVIPCIFCEVSSNTIIINENKYQGRRCPHCALIYISPRPSADEIENVYGHNNAQVPADVHIAGEFLNRLYARHTIKIIKKHLKHKKINERSTLLEIGAGAGYFLNEAHKAGFDPYALELNPVQADYIERTFNIACERSLLSATSFGSKKFDLIYHCDVLSHFYDPIKSFEVMHKKLTNNGLLVFQTGNIADIDTRYLPAFESFQYPDHLFFFNERTIKQLLAKTGFTLIALHRYNILPQLWLLKWLHRGKAQTKATRGKEQSANDSIFKLLAKKIYYRGLYLLRYKIGALLPKTGKPQTIIVVAQKR